MSQVNCRVRRSSMVDFCLGFKVATHPTTNDSWFGASLIDGRFLFGMVDSDAPYDY
ncbi:hypothetical protein QT971_12695 [Microcoleus sp. herbarium19]|uniref:hypothetical protein n=1 Tax=Microcoleus sp. herbarium7 TaxID=3055435 RepID=UPI002FD11720